MKKPNFIIVIFFSVISLIFTGCASSSKVKTEAKNEQPASTDTTVKESPAVNRLDFILGIGDSVDITVYRHDDLKRSIKIDRSGMIMFPLVGDVIVAGKSIYQVRDELRERLSGYIINPQVLINVSSIQSQKVIVLGEVNSPGVFLLDVDMNASDVIAKAGGMTTNAKDSKVVVLRKESEKVLLLPVDMHAVLKEGDLSGNLDLKNGDIIYVPKEPIASASWLFSQIGQILGPFVTAESGIVLWPQVKDVFEGKSTSTPLSIPAQ
ncbi:MAG: polysaccharide biosynthesis/export family protein [Nitrospirae bacterium]|nr:polysaccharide biosynthesis/export family protein [Nitrospirota bacterium]